MTRQKSRTAQPSHLEHFGFQPRKVVVQPRTHSKLVTAGELILPETVPPRI